MYLYIHGFNSSPASIKARQLHSRLVALGRGAEFACPALSAWPREAMHQLEASMRDRDPSSITLVGSSLGGFYGTWLAERYGCRAVLVNPAVEPHLGLAAYLGPQRNLYSGAAYELTRDHLVQMAAYQVAAPTRLERYYLMVTTGDEVLDYRIAVAKYAGARQLVVQGSDHGFAQFEQYLDSVLAFGDGAS
jgi:predicted esterase YcpF (UPF0227 family)